MGVYMASKTLNMNDLFLFSFNLLIFIGEEDLRSAMTWIVKNVPLSDIVFLTVTLRTLYYGTLILLRYHKNWNQFKFIFHPMVLWPNDLRFNKSLWGKQNFWFIMNRSFSVKRIMKRNLKSYSRFSIKSSEHSNPYSRTVIGVKSLKWFDDIDAKNNILSVSCSSNIGSLHDC